MLRRKSLCGAHIQIVVSEPGESGIKDKEYDISTGVFQEVQLYTTYLVVFID